MDQTPSNPFFSSEPTYSFSSDSPCAFQLTPYQDDGTYASSILFVQNQFKRLDVQALYQYIREVMTLVPLPELSVLAANATERQVLWHRIDAGNLHITLHWFEHLAFHWENVVYQPDAPVTAKRERSPYAMIVRVGDEDLPSGAPLIPSLKAMLVARVLAMYEQQGMPKESFRYYDLFDHELAWLQANPLYKCTLNQLPPTEEKKE